MKYNFDKVIDRNGTDAIKIENMKSIWGRTDLIPLWVADMDFETAPFITDAIRKRCENGILGYTCKSDEYYNSIISWVKSRYGMEIEKEMINFIPGIVPGLGMAMNALTKQGDKVMIQPPVYHPFRIVTEENQREVVYNPLKMVDGVYCMDFEAIKRDIKGCSLFILCNPHNPGGRVWRKDELETLAEICYEEGVLVFSDEIHADLTFLPLKHTPFSMVSEKARMNSVTFMSPSKAFNMPGLSASHVIIYNEEIRERFKKFMAACELDMGHVFSFISVTAAYSNGEEWLEQCKSYIQKNIDYIDKFTKEHTPKIKVLRPQASYLVWLDCKDLALTQDELNSFFSDEANLALNNGEMFGKEGIGYMRLNAAAPKSIIEKAMNQLKEAYIKRF